MNPRDVTDVLLGDQWYKTEGGLVLSRFRFIDGHSDSKQTPMRLTEDGDGRLGFAFKTPEGGLIRGPLTAIQAVKVPGY